MKWFKKKEVPEEEEYMLKDKEIEKLSKSFVSRDEKYITSLGNGYIMNYLVNKSTKKGFAFITDKRVYFKGSCLSGTGNDFVQTNEERTVDIKNITGSGFIHRKRIGLLFAIYFSIIICVAGIIACLYLSANQFTEFMSFNHSENFGWLELGLTSLGILGTVILGIIANTMCYLTSQQTLFRIEYAGGNIAFDVSFYAKAEIDDFQKQLRRAKDMAEENTTVKAVTTETPIDIPTQNSSVDDLRKYAELLKDGLITQEEYDAMKKKVLGL